MSLKELGILSQVDPVNIEIKELPAKPQGDTNG